MKNLRTALIIAAIFTCFALVGVFQFQPSQAQTAVTTISGKFYKLDVLATNTSLGIASIFPGASINDNGVVSFSGNNSLFMADGISPVRNIRAGNYDATQISNGNLVIARSVVPTPPQQFLSRFDTNLVPASQTVVAGVNATGLMDFSNIPPASFGMNNLGQPVFSATHTNGTDRQLVTGIRTAFNRQTLATTPLTIHPVIDDDGNVVVRAGNTNTDPIRLYNFALTAPLDIATVSPTTFSALGQSPGISDNGKVIVFYGVAQAGNTIPTNPGPGIFASIVDGTTRRIIRIAGREIENVNATTPPLGNRDGVCDTGEQCIPGELGFTSTGGSISFSSFGADDHIGVIHRLDELPSGIDNDTFIVTFLGTPSSASSAPQYFSNQLGLWTIRVDMKTEAGSIREKPFRATPVIQVGDNLGARQVTGLSIYDPIALAATNDDGSTRLQMRPDHRLVFQATTISGAINGTAIVRATYTDSDEDGLADHWERNGIDFDQDGDTDLALNNPLSGDAAAAGANPNRKDVYVEIDYMENAQRTHRPDFTPRNVALAGTTPPMTAVRNAFANAPIRNLNGTSGITLHTFVDQAIPEVVPLLFPNRGPNNDDDFDDVKFGSNGPTPGTPCGTGPNDGHFGTASDRSSTNCSNILGAKRLVFRYAIFAQTLAPSGGTTAEPRITGRAETLGNDLVVAFTTYGSAVRPVTPSGVPRPFNVEELVENRTARWIANGETTTFDIEFASLQAYTFMHELGHTLGLKHGGGDDINCKPNYLSVMSYSRQSIYGGNSYGIPTVANGRPVRTNARLDYSRGPVLPVLMENGLMENAGIGGPNDQRTIYGVTIPVPIPTPSPGGAYTNARISPANIPLDWNGNGTINPGAVSVNINNINNVCVDTLTAETFNGFDDWGNLRYNFFSAFNFNDGAVRATDVGGPEIDGIDIMNGGLGSNDVDGDGIENISDNCIFSPNAGQTDGNSNGIGDACDPLTTVLADLSVTLVDTADPVQISSPFDYIATVRNSGPNASQNVNFTNQLPANVTLNSVTSSQGSCGGTSTIVCALGTMNNNSTATVTIRVTPSMQGRLDNYVSVVSGTNFVVDTLDPNVLNNTGSASTVILDSSQTFTISGRVADEGSVGIAGVFVIYGNSPGESAQTNANGDYSFSVAAGGIYNLTPVKFGFSFSPQSQTVAYIDSNQVVNFTGVAATTIAKKADFDGDGKTDLSVFRPSDANWYVSRSSDAGFQITLWGFSTDKLTPGDYDGDGKTDHAVFRPSDGTWYILQSSNSTLAALLWGVATDIPVAGDYDGDGKTDFAVWRPSEGNWYVYQSSNQTLLIVNFGQNGDVPLVGDFDGDRKTDFAFFTPSSAMWNIQLSTGGTVVKQFGAFDDVLVPADFDGDGTTDFGVWRSSTGFWYFASAYEAAPAQNFTAIPFGQSGDVPVPGDYDGDGKYDIAVFRNGTWYIVNSQNGSTTIVGFGVGGDKPIPNAYLPQ